MDTSQFAVTPTAQRAVCTAMLRNTFAGGGLMLRLMVAGNRPQTLATNKQLKSYSHLPHVELEVDLELDWRSDA